MKRFSGAAWLSALLCAAGLAQAALPAPDAQLGGIRSYHLPNGLQVLFLPDSSKAATTVNLTYRVGSRHDPYGATGSAHLLEHMLFKGTPRHPHLLEELNRRGMQFNGSTSFDRTSYSATFPADPATLEWVLAMEADRMMNARLDEAELRAELQVVENEMDAADNDPAKVLAATLGAISFDWHNYAHATLGSRADVEHARIPALRAYYREFYRPDNAVLVVAGRLDEDQTWAAIVRLFGPLQAPPAARDAVVSPEPQRNGEREVTVRRPAGSPALAVFYPVPPAAASESASVAVLAHVLGAPGTGRLYQALVVHKLAVSVQAQSVLLNEGGYLLFTVQLGTNQDAQRAEKAMVTTIEDLVRQPVTPAELKAAQVALLNEMNAVAGDPGRLGSELSNYIGQGDWRLFFLQRDRIARAALPAVQQAAAAYLQADNRSIGRYLPGQVRTPVPEVTKPDLNRLFAALQPEEPAADGEAFEPSPANIEQRTRRLIWPAGPKIALLSKKTRGGYVTGRLVLHLGTAQSLFRQTVTADLAADMLMRGAGGMSRADLQKRIAELGGTLQIGMHGQDVNIRFTTVRDHLPAFFQLLRQVLREPDFSEPEFALLEKENISTFEQARSDPRSVAGRAANAADNALYPAGDVRSTATMDDIIDQFKAARLAEVQDFYRTHYGSTYADMALVGDFDSTAALQDIHRLLDNWANRTPYVRAPLLGPAPVMGPAEFDLNGQTNAFYLNRLDFPVNDEAPDYAALMVINKVFASGAHSRLFERLRSRDGISYNIGSRLTPSSAEPVSKWLVYATCASKDVVRLQAAFSEEIARLHSNGITPAELADAKQALLQERRMARAQDAALAEGLAAQMDQGRTMEFSAALDDRIAALNSDQVNEVLRRHVKPEKFSRYLAGQLDTKAAADRGPAQPKGAGP